MAQISSPFRPDLDIQGRKCQAAVMWGLVWRLLTWLTFGVLALPRLIEVLFCVRIRWNLNTKVGP